MSKRAQPEADLQKAVVAHLRNRGVPDMVWKHIPNGEARDARTGAKLKAMGVVPGVADLEFLRLGKSYALELKAKGGRLSPSQRAYALQWVNCGGIYAVHDNIDAALAQLEHWGLLRPAITMREAAE